MYMISFTSIESLNTDPSLCYNWAEYMISLKDRTMLPPKISMIPSVGVFHNVMPSIITDPTMRKLGG